MSYRRATLIAIGIALLANTSADARKGMCSSCFFIEEKRVETLRQQQQKLPPSQRKPIKFRKKNGLKF